MGDRTSVYLTVPTQFKEPVAAIFKAYNEHDLSVECDLEKGFTYFDFSEINYGMLLELPELIAMGIPFISAWDRGDDFPPGFNSVRFTPEGEIQEISVDDDDCLIGPGELTPLLDDTNPEAAYWALAGAIRAHTEKTTPLPWDNQEEYGKIFRLKQLIEGSPHGSTSRTKSHR